VTDAASSQKVVRDFTEEKKAVVKAALHCLSTCMPLRGDHHRHGRMTVRLLTKPGLAAPTMSLTRGVRVLDRA
jgi:hypothetical protein